MKVALVYDRVNKWGGAERVLLALHEMFPRAPLFTAVYNPETAPWAKVFPKIHTSFLQNFPLARTRHDLYAALMPVAFELFNFDEYDLVISVTSEAAKGIITKPTTRYICYCLTPTRYLWSGYDFYFRNPTVRFFAEPMVSYLRKWDKIAAKRPDIIVGISKTVASRIERYYERETPVVYPPVQLQPKASVPQEDYFLVVSRLVPYKRVDLAVRVFNRLKWPLVIVGTGSEEEKLRRIAKGNIHFAGEVNDVGLVRLYTGCKAFIAPQEEDFGIAIVEAQAAGKPVIAYRGGGATETVVEGKTGIFFDQQSVKSLLTTVRQFEPELFKPEDCKKNAEQFSKERFKREFARIVRRWSTTSLKGLSM